jgi:WD40 repeat protein
VDRVAFSPDCKLLGATTDDSNPSTLNLWTVATWKHVSLPSHGANVPALAFSSAGPLAATSGGEGIVRFWNLQHGTPHTLSLGPGPFGSWAYDLAFTPEGRYLATANYNGTVTILRAPPLLPAYSPGPPRQVLSPEELAKKPSAADALDPKVMVHAVLTDALLKGQAPAALPAALGGKGKLPSGLVAILGGKDGHTGQVYGVAIRPDGKVLASAGNDRSLRLWELATGKSLQILTAHQDRVYCVAFSPDGRFLASGAGDGCIKIWDAATGKELHSLLGHKGLVASVQFSPDSQLLVTTGEDGLVRIWEAASGKMQRLLARGSNTVWSAAFSPDGKTVAATLRDDGIISLWDVATGWEVAALKGHAKAWMRSVAFSPDGQTLASSTHSHEDPIRLWDLAGLRPKKLLVGHTSSVISCCWDASGRLLASIGDTEGTARVWDTTTSPARCKVLQVTPPGQAWLHYVAFTPEGRYLATANPEGSIYIIKLAAPGARVEIPAAAPGAGDTK